MNPGQTVRFEALEAIAWNNNGKGGVAYRAAAIHPAQQNLPARDAQAILGHAHISTTQQIYTYVDETSRLDAVTRLNELLSGAK